MQTISASLKTALIDIDARATPRVLVDLYELYASTYVPGASGFAPADAIETFASEAITWNGIAYMREVVSRSDVVRNMGEKTNSVSLTFSNISRYLSTLAQSQTIEGLFLVIRCVVPSVTDDSLVLFVGRCDKPSDVDKKSFSLSARQDFGNINQTLPPRKFTAEDPSGRLPTDVLYEGINFVAVAGSFSFPEVVPKSGIAGLIGRRKTVYKTEQWSSLDRTPYGQVIPEVFGRCQMPLIPFAWADKGVFVTYLMAACGGPIAAVANIKSQTAGVSDPYNLPGPVGAIIHLGDLGGTGTNLGNTHQTDLGGGGKFSHLAYIEGGAIPTEFFQNPNFADPNVLNEPPEITALIKGRVVPLPNSSGVYSLTGSTDNPVHISRFILTNPSFVNINSAFMEDAVNYQTGLHCDQPLMDEAQLIVVPLADVTQGGESFSRFRSTGLYRPRFFLYNYLGDTSIVPEIVDGPYVPYDPLDPPTDPPLRCPIGQHHDPDTGTCVADLPGTPTPSNATQPLLRKRYTVNVPITDEVRAVDFLYKTIFPAAKLFMRVNKYGRYEIRSERPSDATRIRSATAVSDTSIPVLDVTPWKSGPDLLIGRLLLGVSLITAEVRNVSSAVYSTSGNSITLVAAVTGGGVTATASGATLTGGSTTVQASGTVTIGGTPAAGNTVKITIDGIVVGYILNAEDTTGTVAAMLTAYLNATKKLAQYIVAVWNSASPTIVTIKCLHGALTADAALLKTHGGPIADPTTAPTLAAAAGALLAGTYQVAYADVNSNGLTALTLIASVVLTASQQINISALPALPGTSRQFFVSELPGSTTLRYQATRTDAANFSINALPLPGAALPPSYNTTAEELIRVAMSFATNSQDVYPVWPASTLLILNDIYLPTIPNGHKYQVTTAGTTGATEPTWPTSAGGTVASGTAVFTEIGSTVLQQAGLTRSNIVKDTFKWPLGSQQSSVNQIKGSYRDATNDFALTPYRINDPVHQAQVKKVYPLEFDGSAIDNFHQFFRISNWLLSKNREGDWFNSLETGPQGLVLEEGDPICASDDSGGLVNVVTRIEELRIKPNHEVIIERGRKYSTPMFSDDVGSHVIPIPSTLRFSETLDSIVEFIDSPPIRDADGLTAGFYVAVSRDLDLSGDWRGWTLQADYGDGYVKIAEGGLAAMIGVASTTLGTVSDPSVWDRTNSVTFTLKYAAEPITFATATEQDLLSNTRRNLFLIDDEYIQAATITDNGNRSYTISTLLRGRFGTDGNVSHGATERMVYIDGSEVFVPIDPVRLNGAFNYKAVTTNQDVADATPVSFTWTGGTVKPLAPVNLRAVRDATGNVLIEWTRRARLGAGLRPLSDVPVAEESQNYRVDIYDGATIVRSLYVDAQQSRTEAVAWVRISLVPPTISADGSLDFTGATGSVISLQSLKGDFILDVGANSSDTKIPALNVSSSFEQTVYGGFQRDFGVTNATINMLAVSTGTLTGIGTYPNRLQVRRVGPALYYFQNLGAQSHLLNVGNLAAIASDVRVICYDESAESSYLNKPTLTYAASSVFYYASQQVEDFGSTQSAIMVRIYQVSAIVGQGGYTEATL